MSGPDLRTSLGETTLVNPVMVAAGCAGTGRELEPFLDLSELGAMVTRSVTLDPRAGGPPPRAVELTIHTVRPERREATPWDSSFSSATEPAR